MNQNFENSFAKKAEDKLVENEVKVEPVKEKLTVEEPKVVTPVKQEKEKEKVKFEPKPVKRKGVVFSKLSGGRVMVKCPDQNYVLVSNAAIGEEIEF